MTLASHAWAMDEESSAQPTTTITQKVPWVAQQLSLTESSNNKSTASSKSATQSQAMSSLAIVRADMKKALDGYYGEPNKLRDLQTYVLFEKVSNNPYALDVTVPKQILVEL